MNTSQAHNLVSGLVVSDLHLFAHRSAGANYFASLLPQLTSAHVLVLNGDIFDFRWSTWPDPEVTTMHALEWLRSLRAELGACEIHYVLGNHDCPAFFSERLDELAARDDRFHWHPFGVRIGEALFVHGDCTHRRMNAAGLCRYREDWNNDRHHGHWRAKAYVAVDRLGVTRFAHQSWFPRNATVDRLVHYLDHSMPYWRAQTRHCFFGHTHLPFSNHAHAAAVFHNTGSGIRGMGFNPLPFSVTTARFESLN